jgi:uncharacterized protein YchJ
MSKRSRQRARVGRNDPCPCGSGTKYKKCHARVSNDLVSGLSRDEIQRKIEELQALQKQRERQQGLGNPIISMVHQGYRFVAVGGRVYYSKQWNTFHDFLMHYIKDVFGSEWGQAEQKKAPPKQHPIIRWLKLTTAQLKVDTSSQSGPVYSAPMTGAMAAFLRLAYDLYVLAHNAQVQRLKNPQQFWGALYETFVAAAFARAGFEISFENEMDSSTSHCEFTAVFKETRVTFSVEAKARAAGKSNVDVGNQLYAALKKEASHSRVVFIDLNVPDSNQQTASIDWRHAVTETLRSREESLTIAGVPAPPAYVFVTNTPYHYALESLEYRSSFMAEGFKIADFKQGSAFPNLRAALAARRKHMEMFKLIESVNEHREIPATFAGEIPEFAFAKTPPRLRIGQKYLVKVNDTEVGAELVDAAVLETEKLAYGLYRTDDGRQIINSTPLSDDELTAYHRYPDTFFGVYRPKTKRVDDPLDLFDFLYETYRKTPRSKLLEFLHDQPDLERLREQSQEELAITYCERLVYAQMLKGNRKNPQA